MRITELRFFDILRRSNTYPLFCKELALYTATYTRTKQDVIIPLTLSFCEPEVIYVRLKVMVSGGLCRLFDIETIDLDQYIADASEIDPECDKVFNEMVKMINDGKSR
jgi:hypothetical protein